MKLRSLESCWKKKKKGTYGDWLRRRFFVGGAAMASAGTAGGTRCAAIPVVVVVGRRWGRPTSVPPLRSVSGICYRCCWGCCDWRRWCCWPSSSAAGPTSGRAGKRPSAANSICTAICRRSLTASRSRTCSRRSVVGRPTGRNDRAKKKNINKKSWVRKLVIIIMISKKKKIERRRRRRRKKKKNEYNGRFHSPLITVLIIIGTNANNNFLHPPRC